jgi:hypothetical protein
MFRAWWVDDEKSTKSPISNGSSVALLQQRAAA